MKNTSISTLSLFGALLALATLAFVPAGRATPYASGLSNNAGAISFRLNESADNVKVISDSGATTNDLGALPAGLHTFPLGISGPYQVQVFKVSPLGYRAPVALNRAAVLQISTDANHLRFNNPRGLAVNNDPASPYFGRVYVSNSSATNSPRAVGDGIYVFNSDLTDALGQGDTALTGGIDFSTHPTGSPYRLSIGKDNNLYIADWSDGNGSVYVTDPDVAAGTNILAGPVGGPFPVTSARIHGSIAAAVVEGSLATGDLVAYVIDEDLQDNRDTTTATQRESLWRHNIGSSLPSPFVPPTLIALHPTTFLRGVSNQVMDLARGPNGNFYASNYRSVGNEGNVWVLDPSGASVLWNSLTESRALTGVSNTNDLLRATGGMDVSPAGDYMAVINIETNGIYVLPMYNGIPDLTNRLLLAGFVSTNQGREVTFDLAGNLYAISSNPGYLRVFSPGGTTTAITGSDGTFSVINPPPVRVLATDDQGVENPADTITFNIWREGSTDAPLDVIYTLTGTASNGVDYVTNVLSATIPAGQTNVLIEVTPLDDGLGEPTETVILTLLSTSEYNAAAPLRATGFIVDDEPIITLTAADNFGSEPGVDTITFNISRHAVGTLPVTVNYTLTGTAANGVDYVTNELSATIPAGETTVAVVITPSEDQLPELTETVIATLTTGVDYTIGSPSTATAYIADNEDPELRITSNDTNAYERFPTDLIVFTITRYGNTNSSQFITYEFSGTAQRDVDYAPLHTDPALFMDVGFVTTNLLITALNDFVFEGDETVTVTLLPNDYTVGTPGSATGRIQEDDYPPENVLYGDNLNGDTSANWIFKFGANNNIVDYSLDWGFDYSTIGAPPAPASFGADTLGLRMKVNKTNATASGSAAVNLYAKDQTFSGDYALRFDMFLLYGTASTTEHGLGGINHSGQVTNRYSQSTTATPRGIDGIWVAIAPDASNARDWAAYTGTNAVGVAHLITNRTPASLAGVITSPPFSAAGSPGNSTSSTNKAWADVELRQVGNTIALRVNKNLIYQFQNTYGFNSGTIMIGFNDQFDSVGSADNSAVFDNVRVVRLGTAITDVQLSGNNVQLDFSSSDGGQPADFHIDSTPTLSPPNWAEEMGAVITTTAQGFRATVPADGSTRFYRVRR